MFVSAVPGGLLVTNVAPIDMMPVLTLLGAADSLYDPVPGIRHIPPNSAVKAVLNAGVSLVVPSPTAPKSVTLAVSRSLDCTVRATAPVPACRNPIKAEPPETASAAKVGPLEPFMLSAVQISTLVLSSSSM